VYTAQDGYTSPIELNAVTTFTSSMNGNYGLVANGAMATLRISSVTVTDNVGPGVFGTAGATINTYGSNRFAGNVGGDIATGTVLTPTDQQ
jgi:hypothetical protein